MIYEISKNILNRKYNGDTPEARQQAINDGFFIDWTKERIKNAFNNGNGTETDLKRYMMLFSTLNDAPFFTLNGTVSA